MAASLRALKTELARQLGHTYAGMYLDLEKFFDYIDPATLILEALELHYPARHQYISLQMHLVPRVLCDRATYNEANIEVLNSILAGLCDSVALTRCLLRRTIRKSIVQNPTTEHSVYVDDCSQITAAADTDGTTKIIAAKAAAHLGQSLMDLGCVV